MKRIVIILAAIALASCGGKKTQDSIRKDITGYQEQIATINGKIKDLQSQLTDTSISAATNLKIISVEAAAPKHFDHYIEVQGRLDGDNNVNVFPEAPGMVKSIFVKEGQSVSAGQILAQLNSSAGQEQIKALETQLKLATDVYNKQKGLWDQNIGSEVQYLQAKTGKEALESQVSSAKKQLDMLQIKAPVSGTIEDLPIKIGQMVGPQMPACKIVNFTAMKAIADVAEAYTSKVNQGDLVKIYITDLKKEIPARIDFCSRYVNPVNRTFSIESHFAGSNDMKANMVAIVKINDYKSDNAFVAAINQIQSDQKGQFILVISKENGKNIVRKKAITTGQSYNGLAEITSGLTKGDNIISTGYLTVDEGEEVTVK
jgi:RND family efflux transporter MFP subunit